MKHCFCCSCCCVVVVDVVVVVIAVVVVFVVTIPPCLKRGEQMSNVKYRRGEPGPKRVNTMTP